MVSLIHCCIISTDSCNTKGKILLHTYMHKNRTGLSFCNKQHHNILIYYYSYTDNSLWSGGTGQICGTFSLQVVWQAKPHTSHTTPWRVRPTMREVQWEHLRGLLNVRTRNWWAFCFIMWGDGPPPLLLLPPERPRAAEVSCWWVMVGSTPGSTLVADWGRGGRGRPSMFGEPSCSCWSDSMAIIFYLIQRLDILPVVIVIHASNL